MHSCTGSYSTGFGRGRLFCEIFFKNFVPNDQVLLENARTGSNPFAIFGPKTAFLSYLGLEPPKRGLRGLAHGNSGHNLPRVSLSRCIIVDINQFKFHRFLLHPSAQLFAIEELYLRAVVQAQHMIEDV